jgi:hypothetical protein
MGIKERGLVKKRGRVARARRPLLFIAVEGNNKTERVYLTGFKHSSPFKLRFVPGNDTDPASMVSILRKTLKNEMEDGDRAFCVVDMDNDFKKGGVIKELLAKNSGGRFDFILSNPCFEVWILCHYSGSIKSFGNGRDVIKDVKKFIPEYNKGMNIHSLLSDKCDTAIEHAKDFAAHHAAQGRQRGDIHANPYTEMHRLVELINQSKFFST